jgi:hypothetical protein
MKKNMAGALTVDKISECWTLALELLAHSEDNWDDDVKDVDSVCCGTGSQIAC